MAGLFFAHAPRFSPPSDRFPDISETLSENIIDPSSPPSLYTVLQTPNGIEIHQGSYIACLKGRVISLVKSHQVALDLALQVAEQKKLRHYDFSELD
ncbi:MAG: hypothetical protein NW237_09710 [Cyanobacteriota bacterium]|nr:hypothetical protein [Cyanobacteriota bacterium]